MGFRRQLDILMAALAMLIAFADGIFILGMTFKISLLGSGSVLLAGLILGRSAAKAIGEIYQRGFHCTFELHCLLDA